MIRNTEPATGRPLPGVPVTPPGAVHAAIRAARDAQPDWAGLPLRERLRRLTRVKELLLDRVGDACDMVIRETGKPRMEALMMEVYPAASFIAHAVRRAPRELADERIPLRLFPHKASRLRYHPRGVIGSITAWNLPLAFFFSDVAPALAAGNAVVVKPSEATPLTALFAHDLCREAGIPGGVVQVVPGFGDTGAALVNAADAVGRADMVVFTGSGGTGRGVGAACAERLIPCILELGGTAAALVLADADLDRAARSVVYGAFANAGQLCVSVNRVFVDARIAEPFTRRVVALTAGLRVGAGPDADVGAITTAAQLAVIQRHVADAVRQGARVLAGGRVVPGPGRFHAPTVLADVTPGMAVMREETFGPVLPITAVPGEGEAVALANDASAGLIGYVFSRNRRRARRVADRLRCGTVIVNDVIYTYAVPETPWGGATHAGLGVVHGARSLRELSEARHINTERLALPVPWMYPYRASRVRMIMLLLRRLVRHFL
jgi:succinate-semialdehyde dehydrogenase/glutarate-semialdehyde dehydrogenase